MLHVSRSRVYLPSISAWRSAGSEPRGGEVAGAVAARGHPGIDLKGGGHILRDAGTPDLSAELGHSY